MSVTKRFWFRPALSVAVLGLAWLLWPHLAGVKGEYLLTDRLIFLLLAGGIFLGAYIRTREHLRAPWRLVFRRRMAMAALVVLSAYVLVGLLDSIHYRPSLAQPAPGAAVQYSVQVRSAFDAIAAPLRRHVEKTYSAPFAVHLYAKETLTLADGTRQQVYPRLRFGGAGLPGPAARGRDIAVTVAWGLLLAALVVGTLWGAVVLALARRSGVPFRRQWRRVFRGETEVPWSVVLYTVGTLLTLLVLAVLLSAKYHILGTDKVGQDVFYLAVKSIRTGLVIGTLTTLVMLPFAIALGIMAGYFRGWVDDLIQYLYTTLSSIPGVLLIAAAILSIQVYIENHPDLFQTVTDRADLRLLALCIILGITSWTSLCRLLRGETLKLREMDYIQAATAFGVGRFTIIARHILPNVMHIVLIIVVLDFSGLVLAEAVLSYVGVGVDPSTVSWGNMINGARLELAREPVVWWSLLAAFVMMFTLVLAANLFSDAVRDAFDPRMKGVD